MPSQNNKKTIAELQANPIQLRLAPPRNNQRACINLAGDFDFIGAVAQLGERVAGSHEVRGSSPLSSTSSDPPITIGASPFPDQLGYWTDVVGCGTRRSDHPPRQGTAPPQPCRRPQGSVKAAADQPP